MTREIKSEGEDWSAMLQSLHKVILGYAWSALIQRNLVCLPSFFQKLPPEWNGMKTLITQRSVWTEWQELANDRKDSHHVTGNWSDMLLQESSPISSLWMHHFRHFTPRTCKQWEKSTMRMKGVGCHRGKKQTSPSRPQWPPHWDSTTAECPWF